MNNINICEADLIELKKKYQGENLDIALNKIKNGYPVQYLIGNVNFYGNIINVNENVLIPRYETEFLVDYIKNMFDMDINKKILDIGAGSGCISISLAKIFNKSEILGIDVSKKAIETAEENKKTNNVNNVSFEVKDVFKIDNFNGYNIIVSNPPYVSNEEEVGLETKYEPHNAIFAENNGLVFYEYIIKIASISDGTEHIFFEIGMNQKEDISNFAKKYLNNYEFNCLKDLSGKDRYIHIIINK